MNREVYPKFVYNILKKFGKYSQIKELVITENGAAFEDTVTENKIKDTDRVQFLQACINEVLHAKKEGINVTGYFIWTLLDNFEWAKGYTQRFGLVHMIWKPVNES